MNAEFIETVVANYLNPRVNLILPNAYWGLGFSYELDMFVITPSGFGWEVEIKVSRSDLIQDKEKKKWKNYDKGRIKRLYFAIPENLVKDIEHIPDKAGVLSITEKGLIRKRREAKNISSYKFTDKERLKAMHLCCMRVWNLKKRLNT